MVKSAIAKLCKAQGDFGHCNLWGTPYLMFGVSCRLPEGHEGKHQADLSVNLSPSYEPNGLAVRQRRSGRQGLRQVGAEEVMNKYHGWIVVTHEPGYRDSFTVEYEAGIVPGEQGGRRRVPMDSAAQAVEFFDKRVGRPVLLTETPVGAYRVYTEEDADKVVISRTRSEDVRANALRTEAQRLVGVLRATSLSELAGRSDEVMNLCTITEQLAELTK